VTFCRSPFELSALELASGIVFGEDESFAEPGKVGPDVDPLRALEEAVLPALQRPPCVVSFSGGRDSSAVLAVAAAVARREGLAPPVPATNVFPEIDSTSESGWQELVVAHLGLDDWARLELRDELDCVGPIATSILERHGLLWPFNVHFHRPLLELARGGSLLTGIGGDEVLGTSQWARAASVLSAAAGPRPRDLARVAVALSPPPVRRLALRRQPPPAWAWLTPEANASFRRAWIAEAAREPLRRPRRWSWWRRRRHVALGFRSLDLIASDLDVQIAHPLADRWFAVSAGRRLGRTRRFDRTAAMRELFAGLLPETLLERESKATFDGAFWGEHSRHAAKTALEQLAGHEELDQAGLASTWGEAVPDAHTFLLLQACRLRELDARDASCELAVGTVVSTAGES
jgi:Asparagine synthase